MDAVESAPSPECGSGRSSPSPAASPEFEFWMVGKQPGSFPSPALLTADELFSDGIVLPLHAPPSDDSKESPAPPDAATQPLAERGPAPTPDLPAVTFKWKDIFKAGGAESRDRKKMERRISSVGGNSELININIWPFSRSRSAGAGALGRSKASPSAGANAAAVAAAAPTSSSAAPAGRKVSSAPCSRSNSRGESAGPGPAVAAVPAAATSMLKRWVPGQGRTTGLGTSGIRLGRASPVWQLRRNKLQQQQAAVEQKPSASAKKKAAVPEIAATSQDDDAVVPSVSAPPAAACRNNASCSEGGEECINPPQGLFGLRTFFSKKVY